MTVLLLAQSLALIGLIFAVGVFAWRWRRTEQRPAPADYAPAKGSPQLGVLYAFTHGMAPWAKESTRRHLLAYLRGVAFHIGIFAGLAVLLSSPWWPPLPAALRWPLAAATGVGALCGLAGAIARWTEQGLRALSTPDDHAAVLLVTLFLLAATGAALWAEAWLPMMYVTGAAMFFYAPLGKIRHCIYFFFSRRFFGLFVGRRAVIRAEVIR